MLNPIFWKKVQGQKHPGRWLIAERQITCVKMFFKTNIGHKHPCIRLFIIEQDTIGKPKKTKIGIQHRNCTLPKKLSYRLWWGNLLLTLEIWLSASNQCVLNKMQNVMACSVFPYPKYSQQVLQQFAYYSELSDKNAIYVKPHHKHYCAYHIQWCYIQCWQHMNLLISYFA